MPFQDDKFSLSVDGTALTVHDVTKDDVMCVQCNVSNSRGYAFGDGYLAVVGKPLRSVSMLLRVCFVCVHVCVRGREEEEEA